jgi:hypothetical protein
MLCVIYAILIPVKGEETLKLPARNFFQLKGPTVGFDRDRTVGRIEIWTSSGTPEAFLRDKIRGRCFVRKVKTKFCGERIDIQFR